VSNFWSHTNRRGLWLADDYGYNLLMSCEDNAVLFTNGDNDTFPLWFAQEVKNTKPSVNVANLSLLNTNWHIKQLKSRGVPISFTDYEIDNLEGLPIPEMKDGKMREGKILITKDIAVRDIIATNGGYKFKKKIFLPIKRKVLPKKYRKKFPKKMDIIRPNYYVRRLPEKYWFRIPEEYLLPQNEFADLVLKEGYEGKIPIYFAVTVAEDNIEGFLPYLKMEGLVNRVVSGGKEYPNTVKLSGRIPPFDVKKTDSLLFTVYRYRSLFDPKVYIDQNCARLLTNYSANYFYLGTAYKILKKLHKAIEVFEQGEKINKRGRTPFPFKYELASLYGELGEYDKVEEYLRRAKYGREEKASLWYKLGVNYLENNNLEKAKKCFRKAIYSTPKKPSWGYSGLIEAYYKEKDTTKLEEVLGLCIKNPVVAGEVLHIFKERELVELQKLLLTEWLKYYPQDTIAKRLLNEG
jgi:tetratricopeptide (TPR) repeat protein